MHLLLITGFLGSGKTTLLIRLAKAAAVRKQRTAVLVNEIGEIGIDNQLMRQLDLRVMEIMDYSEGNRHVGNTDLPKEVVDRYYHEFPDVLGFINGYGTARTYDLRDGKPLISYDYYLDVNRSVKDAAADAAA